MADLTRTISLTVPDAYLDRLQAWVTSLPPLLQPSGEVDENGDPIMEEVPETIPAKFDRVAKAIVVSEIRQRVRAWEIRQQQSIDSIEVS